MKVKVLHVHLFIQKRTFTVPKKSLIKSKCTLFDFKELIKKKNKQRSRRGLSLLSGWKHGHGQKLPLVGAQSVTRVLEANLGSRRVKGMTWCG